MGHAVLKCYRVWFVGGSALLVDAESEVDAICKAQKLAFQQTGEPETAKRVECLTPGKGDRQ